MVVVVVAVSEYRREEVVMMLWQWFIELGEDYVIKSWLSCDGDNSFLIEKNVRRRIYGWRAYWFG